jgi:hypothetical protein
MKTRSLLTDIFNNELRDGSEGIDVFLFVDTLSRGWNSPITKKVINACPSRSPRAVEQILGRLTRPFRRMDGNLIYGQAVDLVDESKTEQVLFSHILNRYAPEGQRYVEGAIVGPGLLDLRYTTGISAFEPIPEVPRLVPIGTPKAPKRTPTTPRVISSGVTDILRDVSNTIKSNPFSEATPINNAELEQYSSIGAVAELIGVTEAEVEDAIMDRGWQLGVSSQTASGEALYYVPNASLRRLEAYLERNS